MLPEVRRCLLDTGALVPDSHIALMSGLHGDEDAVPERLYPHFHDLARLAHHLAAEIRDLEPDVILSLSHATGLAHALTAQLYRNPRLIHPVWAEWNDDPHLKARRLDIPQPIRAFVTHARVVVIDDMVKIGWILRELRSLARTYGGTVVGAAAIADLSDLTPEDLGVPVYRTLGTLPAQRWKPRMCPACRRGRKLAWRATREPETVLRFGRA